MGLGRWLICVVMVGCAPSLDTLAQHALMDAGVDDTIVALDGVAPPADVAGEPGPPADAPLADVPMEPTGDAPPLVDAPLADVPTEPTGDAPVPGDASNLDALPSDAPSGDALQPGDGPAGDGSPTDAGPDAPPNPPGFPPGGSHDDDIQSFYACNAGTGAAVGAPLLFALAFALRRRRKSSTTPP